MAKEILLATTAKAHLKDLAEEIVGLLVHAQPSQSGTPPTSWTKNSQDIDVALTVLLAASASINDGVTRFNLVFKANPKEAASESMTRELGGFCQKLISSLSLLSSVGASDSMVGFFSANVRAVLHSLKDLVEALLDPSKHRQLNSLTGMVWKACKDMQQAPNTNKLACRREMMQWSVAIKDTIDEFQEALEASKAGNCSADGSDVRQETGGLDEQMVNMHLSGEGLEEDDLDFDDLKEYSQLELQWVNGTIQVLRLFRRCLKGANDALNTVDSTGVVALSGSNESDAAKLQERRKSELAWAQSLQDCSRRANECAAELGVLMYPPINGKELSGRSESLRRELVELCNILSGREEKAQGNKDATRQSPLAAAVEDKFSSLQNMINV